MRRAIRSIRGVRLSWKAGNSMSRLRDALVDAAALTAALCALVLTAGVAREHFGEESRPSGPQSRSIQDWEEYAETGHRLGAVDPAVTIIWWGDYQCPFCRRLAPALEALLDHHGDRVAVVYRHWPLASHPAARPGARAAVCADAQGGFTSLHELLYGGTAWISDPSRGLVTVAENAGIPDLAKFDRCLGDSTVDKIIELDVAAIRGLEATGVPSLLLDGLLLGNVPDSTGLFEMVRERLAH